MRERLAIIKTAYYFYGINQSPPEKSVPQLSLLITATNFPAKSSFVSLQFHHPLLLPVSI